MQNVTLRFHPLLRKYTQGLKEHTLNVNDILDIRNALESLFPRLGIHIRQIKNGNNRRENMALINKNKRILNREDYFINRLTQDDTEFMVVPLFWGGGGDANVIQMIAGAALILVGAVITFFGGGIVGIPMITAGAGMLISGVIGKLMATDLPDETTDSEARRDNKIFNGLQNTIVSNTPVALIYGRTRVGGQFISGEIRSYEHGRNQTLKVEDIFPAGAS